MWSLRAHPRFPGKNLLQAGHLWALLLLGFWTGHGLSSTCCSLLPVRAAEYSATSSTKIGRNSERCQSLRPVDYMQYQLFHKERFKNACKESIGVQVTLRICAAHQSLVRSVGRCQLMTLGQAPNSFSRVVETARQTSRQRGATEYREPSQPSSRA
jgi:hypothetical protein